MNINEKIIILSGDPNSINSEIIFKSWKKINKSIKKIYLISNYELIKKQFKILKYKIKTQKVEDINELSNNDNLKILNVDLKYSNPFNVEKKSASSFIIKSLNLGHKLAQNKQSVLGLINCPINKNLLPKRFIGATEFFADKCKIKKNSEVMLIKNNILSVSPITTHLEVKKIPQNINKLVIINKVKQINSWFKKVYKIKPNIAVLGLNPHNSELKKTLKKKIIIPAIRTLKKLGLKVSGPLVADTIFINDYKKFDVIVGMYHDQVIAPFKTLFKFDAINMTLGLKYLRLSPDHGTAKDIIFKNKANPYSLIKCINTILKLG